MPATFKCRLCVRTFVLDESMVAICPTCCDTMVEPIGGTDLYENAEVACEVEAESTYAERHCKACNSTTVSKLTEPQCWCNSAPSKPVETKDDSACNHCGSWDHYSHECCSFWDEE